MGLLPPAMGLQSPAMGFHGTPGQLLGQFRVTNSSSVRDEGSYPAEPPLVHAIGSLLARGSLFTGV